MDPIDGEIRRALAVDPSPAFLVRVRTRIAEEPAPGSRRLSWVVVAAAVFAVALVALVAIVQRPPAHSQAPAMLTARSSIGAVGTMTAVESVYARHARDAGTGYEQLAAPKPEGRRRELEVLIAADEATALRQLILSVQEGRIELAPALATPPVDEITIEPITIAPIPPMTGEQGVRQ